METLKLSEIVVDKTLQVRSETKKGKVKEYARELREGAEFPPITVCNKEGKYFLVDGFHRLEAYKTIKQEEVNVDVLPDGADPRACAVRMNIGHLNPLTRKEKNLLSLEFINKNPNKTTRELAAMVGVSATHISKLKRHLKDTPKVDLEKANAIQVPRVKTIRLLELSSQHLLRDKSENLIERPEGYTQIAFNIPEAVWAEGGHEFQKSFNKIIKDLFSLCSERTSEDEGVV